MKRISLALFSLAALLFVEAAAAQTPVSVSQTISLSFPRLAAIAITSTPVVLEISDIDAQDGYTPVSDASTTLYQLNNYGSMSEYLRIQAQLNATLPAGLALTVSASGTGGQGAIALGDGVSRDVVRNITASGTSHTLTYTLAAEATATTYELPNATVTYTLTAQ